MSSGYIVPITFQFSRGFLIIFISLGKMSNSLRAFGLTKRYWSKYVSENGLPSLLRDDRVYFVFQLSVTLVHARV